MPPDYLFRSDRLAHRPSSAAKRWDWVELRPQTLCGFAPGTPMSIVPAHRGLCRDLQGARACRCASPASPAPMRSIYQVTESTHFANAALWAATEPRCGAPRRSTSPTATISAGRTCGRGSPPPSTCRSASRRPSASPSTWPTRRELWRAMTKKHGLKPFAYDQLVAWPFADYVFGCDWDVMSDVTKIRAARLPRRGRQRGDVRAAAAPLSQREDRSVITPLDPARYVRTPWKNGGGVTVDIAFEATSGASAARRSPRPARSPTIRASTGCRSWCGQRPGVADADGEIDVRRPFRPVRFAGETPIVSRLEAGPVEVINLMGERRRVRLDLACPRRRPARSTWARACISPIVAGAAAACGCRRHSDLPADGGLRIEDIGRHRGLQRRT